MIRRLLLLGTVLAFIAPIAGAGEKPARPTEGNGKVVEYKGILRTGLMAIGGETTGTAITVKGKTYELDFRKRPKLRAMAEKLNKKEVIVHGALQRRKGVEIRERWIIMVSDLRPAKQTDNGAGDTPRAAGPAEKAVGESGKKDDGVRKLAVEVDPVAGSKAKPGVSVARDETEMTTLFGEAIAKQITGKIDFAKEKVVHVSWGSSGPPFGKLRYEINKDTITFFVWQPRTFIAGQAYRLGNDFFAVPKNSKVEFGGAR